MIRPEFKSGRIKSSYFCSKKPGTRKSALSSGKKNMASKVAKRKAEKRSRRTGGKRMKSSFVVPFCLLWKAKTNPGLFFWKL